MQTHKSRLDPTCLGEAKLLVEVELDKPFPKQIALDDKQGNIFLVDVEYTWIPSVCGRCGHLGHKEKRCLLPAATPIVETDSKEELPAEILRGEEEMVQARLTAPSDQVVLLLENSAENLLTPKKSEPTAGTLEITNKTVNENLQSLEDLDPEDLSTPVNNSTHSKVTIATGSSSHFTSSPLAVTHTAPTHTTIMEEIPSPIIVFEAKSALADNSLASSHSLIHGSPSYNQIDQPLEQDDEDGSMGEATADLNMSRGGKPIKPLQKFQDMEWKTVRGRGKCGRRGRGNHLPTS
ncbi:unnamed protein product [Brassica oleracea var. botrytis]